MFEKNRLSILAFIASAIGLVAYYFGLFVDLTGDAGKYAAIARHVVESGDYINLKIHGDAYDQKPPLIFWLASWGFELGGFQNWSYKIFSVLYGFLGIFFTYKLGESLYNKRSGMIAAYLLFFSEFYFLYCMDVHTDLLLQANVAFAIWQLHEYLKTKKNLNFALAFAAIGLALMSKGPIGGAVPAFALGTHLLLKRDFKQLFHPKWILGIAIAMLVASPAFIGLLNQFGLEGIKFFFWTNNVGRISGEYVGENTDYLFYVHNMLYMYAPWSLLLFVSIFFEFKSIFKNPLKQKEYLLLGGIWIYFIIISVAKAKSPNYIFILIPLFTVLTAKWIDHFISLPESKEFKILKFAQNTSFILLCLFLLALMTYLFPSWNWIYWVLLIFILLASFYIFKQKGFILEKLLLPSILIMSLTSLYMNKHVLPYTFSFQSSITATQMFNKEAKPGDILYNYIYDQFELFFYAKTDAVQIKDKTQLNDALHKHGSWIYTNEAGFDSIKQLTVPIDTYYILKHKGMNRIGRQFPFPETREASLESMYLIKTK